MEMEKANVAAKVKKASLVSLRALKEAIRVPKEAARVLARAKARARRAIAVGTPIRNLHVLDPFLGMGMSKSRDHKMTVEAIHGRRWLCLGHSQHTVMNRSEITLDDTML